jgi:hypothetical protein
MVKGFVGWRRITEGLGHHLVQHRLAWLLLVGTQALQIIGQADQVAGLHFGAQRTVYCRSYFLKGRVDVLKGLQKLFWLEPARGCGHKGLSGSPII